MKVRIEFEVEPDNYTSNDEMLAAIKRTWADHREYKAPIATIEADEHRGANTEIFMVEGTVKVEAADGDWPANHNESRRRLEVLMTEADDFDPEDGGAKLRSDMAKALDMVQKEMDKFDSAKAHTLRLMAIEVMEGN